MKLLCDAWPGFHSGILQSFHFNVYTFKALGYIVHCVDGNCLKSELYVTLSSESVRLMDFICRAKLYGVNSSSGFSAVLLGAPCLIIGSISGPQPLRKSQLSFCCASEIKWSVQLSNQREFLWQQRSRSCLYDSSLVGNVIKMVYCALQCAFRPIKCVWKTSQ